MSGPRDDGSLVWLGGGLVPIRDARISVFDHGLLFGDGVFDTFRAVEGRVFRAEDHLARLERSSAAIGLALPGGRDAARAALLETIAANGHGFGYAKAIVTRGAGDEPVLAAEGLKPELIVISRPSLPSLPEELERDGLAAAVVGTRKTPASAFDPRVKSLNYLNVIRARLEAKALGADDALMLDERGAVVEASVANVLVVRGDGVLTPDSGCLEGITREVALEAAERLGFAVRRTTLYPGDLTEAEEVLLTNTGVGVVPVTRVDGRPVGAGVPGPAFRALADAYREALLDPAQGTPAT